MVKNICGVCKKESFNEQYNFIIQEKGNICKEMCVYYNFCSLFCYKETFLYTTRELIHNKNLINLQTIKENL